MSSLLDSIQQINDISRRYNSIQNLIGISSAYQFSKRFDPLIYSPAFTKYAGLAAQMEALVPSSLKANSLNNSNLDKMFNLSRQIQFSTPMAITNILQTPSYLAAQNAVTHRDMFWNPGEIGAPRQAFFPQSEIDIGEDSAQLVSEALTVAIPSDAKNKQDILDSIKRQMTPEVVLRLIYLLAVSIQFVLMFSNIDNASLNKTNSALEILLCAAELHGIFVQEKK